MDEILEFIKRRFPVDCNWITGNCYYFAIILLYRFPKGIIYYDVINGHFIFKYDDYYYDWTGITEPDGYLVEWDKFDEYDSLLKQRIIRDCISIFYRYNVMHNLCDFRHMFNFNSIHFLLILSQK